jgi:exopolysaccharide biosynthesis polyprenyl glycosylphosphotransferase
MSYLTLSLLSVSSVVVLVMVLRRAGTPSADRERVLLVGPGPMTAELFREIEARPELGWRVVGLLADLREGEDLGVGPWLGPLRALPDVIDATAPTRVIVAPLQRRAHVVDEPLLDARLRGVPVEDAREAIERATGKLAIERLSPHSLLTGGGFRHSDFVQRDSMLFATRALSVVAAALGLLVCAPVFAIIALAIRIDSPGPILFRHRRVGMRAREFDLLKFRTMRDDTTRPSEWVCDNAHRITRVGRWLRRFRLDELPQLINVLRGEMNLVGPRPHPASNYQLFLEAIPHYRLRQAVRPGITGWAQIRYGYANGLEEETEKMRYDLYYIKHRSFWFDIRILFLTVAVLLFDKRNHEGVRQSTELNLWAPAWIARGRQPHATSHP